MKYLFAIFFLGINQLSFAQIDSKFQFINHLNTGSTSSNWFTYNWSEPVDSRQGIKITLHRSRRTTPIDLFVEEDNAIFQFGYFTSNNSTERDIQNCEVYIDGNLVASNTNLTSIFIWNAINDLTEVGTFDLVFQYDIESDENGGEFINILRSYKIHVVPKSDEFHKDQHGNTMRAWKSNTPNGHPIILSVGFDSYGTKTEQYYRRTGWNLFNCLLEQGFDIYVVYYKFNAQDLRNNAAVYTSAIRYISQQKYTSQKVIAAGMSMGGLITRYALVRNEHQGMPLPISKWLSLDAPHQGAVIDAKLQEFYKDNLTDPFALYAINNDAAKIMLQYHHFDVAQNNSNMHIDFYNELNNMNGDGYPHKTLKNIGVAFSNDELNSDYGIWLNVKVKAGSATIKDQDFELQSTELISGSLLPRLNAANTIVSFGDIVPWSPFFSNIPIADVEVTQYQDPTFI